MSDTQTQNKLKDRADRKRQKRETRKSEIAASALDALKELGYANTSLRDIAAQSDVSLGSLGYYFTDKSELIAYCVQVYKKDFVARLRRVIEDPAGRDAVIERFADSLARSVIEDRAAHRLWYDIRNQAQFDPVFRPVVAEIESWLIDVVALAASAAGVRETGSTTLGYAMIDGVFRYFIQSSNTRDMGDHEDLAHQFSAVLHRVLDPEPGREG